jgi:hypothetical protein
MSTPNPSAVDELNELSELLLAAQAHTKITRARVSRSTLYDPRYHTAVIACAMRLHGDGAAQRILTPWLKLLQFVAARPTLVAPFFEYAKSRRNGDLQSWSRMPRGYLGDETHDDVVDFLVASGVLRKAGDWIETSTRYELLVQLAERIEADGLFAGERRILERLREVRVTKALLGVS